MEWVKNTVVNDMVDIIVAKEFEGLSSIEILLKIARENKKY
jgi:hypothetical protein